ncbi:MAG: hypothetical protein BV457_03260 [Thermoplasmata archaeon M9B1D]|nr:MAG: hypothetical protein BV457_03260 [Thermoplasmata archaeon M9B1D]PNX50852.1 MAG: hypothetical protein BV456_05280 [Thermoplasmata archaeon M8B2D]
MLYLLRFAVNDLRNIIRDRFFLFAFFAYPILLIVFSRILVHIIEPKIGGIFQLASEFSLVLMFFVVIIPFIFSFITAFLILDERDEHLLTVLRVMPISRTSFLAFRMFFMLFFSFIVLLIFPPLSGLVNMTEFSYLSYIPVALLFALFTPVASLFVTSFATNKVQAFAIFKIGGSVFLIPIFAFLLNLGNLKWIFSPVPTYWSLLTLDNVLKNGSVDVIYLAIGFVYHLILIAVLFHIFNKKY